MQPNREPSEGRTNYMNKEKISHPPTHNQLQKSNGHHSHPLSLAQRTKERQCSVLKTLFVGGERKGSKHNHEEVVSIIYQ